MRFFSLLSLCFILNKASTQNITVLNNYNADSSIATPENFKLVNSSEYLFVVNDYELIEANSSHNLQGLINYSINSLLDENFKINRGVIAFSNSESSILSSLTALVNNACWLFDSGYKDGFKGFSSISINKLNEIFKLKNKKVDTKSFQRTYSDIGEVSLFYFQKEVLSFKKSISRDISNFITKKEIGYEFSNDRESIDSENAPSYILPIEDKIEPEISLVDGLDVMTIAPNATEKYNKYLKKNKKSKSNENIAFQNSLNDRILQLLENNNKLMSEFSGRFDSMQNQIDEIKKGNSIDQDNKMIINEIDDLKTLVKNITNNGNTVTNKKSSDIVEIYFSYNSTELNSTSKIYLNKVLEGLIKNKTYKILITGFADKAGNADYNLLLSQRRAIAVKEYLEKNGIENNRLVVNFYGDSKAVDKLAEDRKVSLEMLVDSFN